MKTSNLTQLLLKYQKAKAKLAEFEIDKQDYPKFRADSEDLFYFTIYIISRYSECIVCGDETTASSIKENLELVSQYYDACFNSKDNEEYSNEFLLIGLSAYFLSNDFGSAKVLCKEIEKEYFSQDSPQYLIIAIVDYLLNSTEISIKTNNQTLLDLITQFVDYFHNGNGYDSIIALVYNYKNQVESQELVLDNIFINVLIAIVIITKQNSAWEIIRHSNDYNTDDFIKYFGKNDAIKIFWEAQKIIAESGILNGKSGIVQLPTGVGKTKSLELIIETGIISNRIKNTIVVSPLRALCNEITDDLAQALQDEIVITQFSDILETDFDLEFLSNDNNNVVICTPEKLDYVLYHQSNVFDLIDLIVFDEAHMFDDGNRGVNFELLISEIRSRIDFSKKQLIMLSAVLPNAEIIKEWLFNDQGVLANSETLKGTPKTLGFASCTKDLHYFTNNFDEEDYFVPKSLEITTLNKLPREYKNRVFPEANNAKDIAIYYSIKLCHNGGIAIYVNRTDSVSTVIKRIIELYDREYDLSEIIHNSNPEETQKITRLFAAYYGENHIFTKASKLGVFPHYSRLPNGLRIAIETAFKKRFICFVVCTSTLAQGVNIPIKYLFMTSNKFDFDNMKVRNFQNLIGRTARSGMYTSGDVIITDPNFFDKKNNHDENYYAWQRCQKLANSEYSEPCSSSILTLINDFYIDYTYYFNGEDNAKYIIDHYNDCNDVIEELHEILLSDCDSDIQRGNLNTKIQEMKFAIQSIESYLCFAYSQNNSVDISMLSETICKNTLAFHIVDKQKRTVLLELFKVIANKISDLPYERLNRYATSMTGITTSSKIENWINENFNIDFEYDYNNLIELIIRCYKSVCSSKYSEELLRKIAYMWVDGSPLYKIASDTGWSFKDVEIICMKTLSYDMSFLVGNIIDIVEWEDENANHIKLAKLQKMLKYGVDNSTQLLICDRVVNDRFISSIISSFIGIQNNFNELKQQLSMHKDIVFNALEEYPTVFNKRIKQIIK